ncbi:MAG: magnesium transporter [Christensenellales bacterium]
MDPAVASGPFITTLIDIIAVIIYYGLCMAINFKCFIIY